MNEKVILILVDGMRPDSLEACGNEYAAVFAAESTVCMNARSVMPSVTLPCHMSLFHSVDPSRHGVLTNTYTPQVRPVNGLFEQLSLSRKKGGMVYNWNELRDLARPGIPAFSLCYGENYYGAPESNRMVTRDSLRVMEELDPDFLFVYLGAVDSVGHTYGWMTEEYLRAVSDSWDSIREITAASGGKHQIIVTADHGGHERSHGTELEEDMRIPLLMRGSAFLPGRRLEHAGLLDIAPTIAKLTGIACAPEWEGSCLL